MLTADRGKLDATARGARKPSSRLRGAIEPLSLARVFLAEKRNRYVTQVVPVDSFRSLREDYEKLSAGLALAELLDRLCPYDRPEPEIFHVSVKALATMAESSSPIPALVWAMARILLVEGQSPDWMKSPPDSILHNSDLCAPPIPKEVCIALDRIGRLDAPPAHLRHDIECVRTISAVWEYSAETRLPALRSFLGSTVVELDVEQ